MNKQRMIYTVLLLLLTGAAIWDLVAHRKLATVRAQSTAKDRSAYVSSKHTRPFTLVTATTLTSDTSPAIIRVIETYAVYASGDEGHRIEWYRDASAPYATLYQLGERKTGEVSLVHVSAKGSIATSFTDKRFWKARAMPSNSCTTPDPGVSLTRNENMVISAVPILAAVITRKSDAHPFMNSVDWDAPDLDCQEVKSVATYELMEGGHGKTVKEPVTLVLAEPDAALRARHKEALSKAELLARDAFENRLHK